MSLAFVARKEKKQIYTWELPTIYIALLHSSPGITNDLTRGHHFAISGTSQNLLIKEIDISVLSKKVRRFT